MSSIAKFLAVSLTLSALAFFLIQLALASDEGVVVDAVALKIKDSKCLTRACKGAHSERGDHCRWTQRDGLKGTCFLCDGNEYAELCGVAANQECEVLEARRSNMIYCGQMSRGLCRKNPDSPTGATCIKDSSTPDPCTITKCNKPASQDVEDPLGP